MDDELSVMSAPNAKRRPPFEESDGRLIEAIDCGKPVEKSHFPLKALATDCLSNVASWLDECSVLHKLHNTGDTLFTNKLNQAVTSLYLSPTQDDDNDPHTIHRLLNSKPFHNMRILYITGCRIYCDGFPWVALPLALTELVVKATGYYYACSAHPRSKDAVRISLPHLKRLRLDMCCLTDYPIRLEDSPSLTRLTLYPFDYDLPPSCEALLLQVPQLTRLSLRYMDKDEDNTLAWNSAVNVDLLTSLTRLTLTNCHIVKITPSIEVLKMWHPSEAVFVSMIKSGDTPFENLRHLHVGITDETDSPWLDHLAKSGAPNLHTLLVEHPGDEMGRVNVWSAFPSLRRLNMAACHCPLFWCDIPEDAVVTVNSDQWNPYRWTVYKWRQDIDRLCQEGRLTQSILKMPMFRCIQFDDKLLDTDIGNAICEAIPVHVLNQVQHITIQSCPATSRVVQHAINAASMEVDFCNHHVDFSKCRRLKYLTLNLAKMPKNTELVKLSLATVPSTVETLKCDVPILMVNTESNAAQCVPIELITRLTQLTGFECSFALLGSLELLPASLELLILQVNYICSDVVHELAWLKVNRSALRYITITGNPNDNATHTLLKEGFESACGPDRIAYEWRRKKRPMSWE